MKERIEKIRNKFFEIFGQAQIPLFVQAPGRVNLIGEHTDYNDGFVLPIAIDRNIIMAYRDRADDKVIWHSMDFSETIEVSLDNISYDHEHKWANYFLGIIYTLKKKGCQISGKNIVSESNIPLGAGLSSSAAIDVITAYTFAPAIDPLEQVRICVESEHNFVGVNCGFMDQTISRFGQVDHALFLDCRSLEYEQIPFAFHEVEIMVCDTGVKRILADSAYNQRRFECEEGARLLQQYLPEIKALRDVSMEQFISYAKNLPEIIRRRCLHVISENDRVLRSVALLKSGNLEDFGLLLYQSHQSLKDSYEVSSPELDLLVKTARTCKGVYGARMTGAGFGGCTVNLVHRDNIEEFNEAIKRKYLEETNTEPKIYQCETSSGAGRI